MQQSAFYAELAELLDTDVSNINPNAFLEDLGWSSLAVVSFIALADENFDVILKPSKLIECKTVGDLIKLLDGKVTA
jgi:acyl carrier protein